MSVDSPPELRGRAREREALDRLVEGARTGQSGVLVLRGEAGIGKSALLNYLCEHASGCLVARAAGVESEMELAYAGLHQLCGQFLDLLPRLPGPQSDALRSAFGLRAGDAPEHFLVGLAVLTLLAEAAKEQPMVCVVDDAQWLDRASGQALTFVARRLAAESVVLVLAVREPDGDAEPAIDQDLAALPGLTVHGLEPGDAQALLQSVQLGPMDKRVRERLVNESRGNPLALLERARGRVVAELAGGFGVSRWRGVPSVEEGFHHQVQALPAETRKLLLVAAAEPLGDPLLLWRAAQRLGMGPTAAEPAEAAGLLTIGDQVIFRHPLVRSVVYRSAVASERRAAHRALAEATDSGADPARRAWHLAAAAAGPDEEVAAELERCADLARARGGRAAQASFLKRAVTLTDDPGRRTDRALAAAEASLSAGSCDEGLGLLAVAEAGLPDDRQRARVTMLRAQARYLQNRGGEAPLLLLRAAQALEPLNLGSARETYLDAWSAAAFASPMARGTSLTEISRAALGGRRPEGPPGVVDLLLEGLSLLCTDERDAALPLLRRAVADYTSGAATSREDLRWGAQAGVAAVRMWDWEGGVAAATRQAKIAREQGSLIMLPIALNVQAEVLCLGGDLRGAALLATEADVVTQVTGSRVVSSGSLSLAGFRGREAEARQLAETTISQATAAGLGRAVQYAHWATAMLCNGLGQYERALSAAQQASDDTPELFVSDWATIELVEAAARIGRPELAQAPFERLAAGAAAAGTDWALGVTAWSRALLSDGADAGRLYREAVDRLARTQLRPALARAQLVFGEWLRRGGQRTQARGQLHSARELFEAMGMEAFAERARRELAATGERVRRRGPDALEQLTAQESEIGLLAAAGHTNPEIGAQLFLSHRTVEWHLRKVFMKLGVSSRRELATALGGSAYPPG